MVGLEGQAAAQLKAACPSRTGVIDSKEELDHRLEEWYETNKYKSVFAAPILLS